MTLIGSGVLAYGPGVRVTGSNDVNETAIVPWTPGRGVSYESALEAEIGALRSVVEQVTKAVTVGNGHVHLFDTDEVGAVLCCTPRQIEAVQRALNNGSSSK